MYITKCSMHVQLRFTDLLLHVCMCVCSFQASQQEVRDIRPVEEQEVQDENKKCAYIRGPSRHGDR